MDWADLRGFLKGLLSAAATTSALYALSLVIVALLGDL